MLTHFEALEADFAREYPFVCGGDLRHALWGDNAIGVRRLVALVKGLSPRSAFMREVYSEGKDWGNTEELLSSIAELLDFGNRMQYQANSKKGSKVWKPLEIPRPYAITEPTRKVATGDELVNFFKEASGRVQTDEA